MSRRCQSEGYAKVTPTNRLFGAAERHGMCVGEPGVLVAFGGLAHLGTHGVWKATLVHFPGRFEALSSVSSDLIRGPSSWAKSEKAAGFRIKSGMTKH